MLESPSGFRKAEPAVGKRQEQRKCLQFCLHDTKSLGKLKGKTRAGWLTVLEEETQRLELPDTQMRWRSGSLCDGQSLGPYLHPAHPPTEEGHLPEKDGMDGRWTRGKGKLSSLHVMTLVDRDWNHVLRGTCWYVLIFIFFLVLGFNIYSTWKREKKDKRPQKCIKGTTLMSSKLDKDSVNIWWMHPVFLLIWKQIKVF